MNDTEHTRIIQSKEYKDFEFNLKQLLVYYCDNNKIEYIFNRYKFSKI